MEYHPHMQTIQVVLGEELLRAADRAARRTKVNRSALIREALRQHLKRLEVREKERRDREGYERYPDHEFGGWEKVAAWPED
jgi:metal-responsive CopG/Arc/MetJ family transcriptional regulator